MFVVQFKCSFESQLFTELLSFCNTTDGHNKRLHSSVYLGLLIAFLACVAADDTIHSWYGYMSQQKQFSRGCETCFEVYEMILFVDLWNIASSF